MSKGTPLLIENLLVQPIFYLEIGCLINMILCGFQTQVHFDLNLKLGENW
jgi:hypothetical protein